MVSNVTDQDADNVALVLAQALGGSSGDKVQLVNDCFHPLSGGRAHLFVVAINNPGNCGYGNTGLLGNVADGYTLAHFFIILIQILII